MSGCKTDSDKAFIYSILYCFIGLGFLFIQRETRVKDAGWRTLAFCSFHLSTWFLKEYWKSRTPRCFFFSEPFLSIKVIMYVYVPVYITFFSIDVSLFCFKNPKREKIEDHASWFMNHSQAAICKFFFWKVTDFIVC